MASERFDSVRTGLLTVAGDYRYEALEDSVVHEHDMSLHVYGGRLQELLAAEAARTAATRCVLRESKRASLLPPSLLIASCCPL